MVRSYEGFRAQLIDLVTLRSRNYVNTDCNIDMLIHVVFAEIATEVKLMWDTQPLILIRNQLIYELPNYELFNIDKEEVKDELGLSDTEYASKFFTEIYDIIDNEGYDVSNFFTEIDANTLKIEKETLELNVDLEFHVLRSVIPSIKVLEPWMYQLMLKPMVEGIMFNIQDSVPSEIDGKLGNLQYQRFFNAKKFLKEILPQKRWISTKQPGTNIVQEGVM